MYKIELSNFSSMSNDTYSKDSPHYLISGSDPKSNKFNHIQEIYRSPLTLVGGFSNLTASLSSNFGYFIDLIQPGYTDSTATPGPANAFSPSDILVLYRQNDSFGQTLIKYNRSTDTSYVIISNINANISAKSTRLVSFNNEIWIVSPNEMIAITKHADGRTVVGGTSSADSWIAVFATPGSRTVSNKINDAFPFSRFLSYFSAPNKLNIIDSSTPTISTTIGNGGTNNTFIKGCDYQGKYIAAVLAVGVQNMLDIDSPVMGVNNSYLQLYSPLNQTTAATYSVRIPGSFCGMATVNNRLYVGVNLPLNGDNTSSGSSQNSSMGSIYMLNGSELVHIFDIDRGTIKSFTYGTDVLIETNGRLMIQTEVAGNIENIIFDPLTKHQFVVDGTPFDRAGTGSLSGFTYLIKNDDFTNTKLKFYVPGNVKSTTNPPTMQYVSKWISINHLAYLEIWHDFTFGSSDSISVTLSQRGSEAVDDIVLSPTININSRMTPGMTKLDASGFSGDFVRINLLATTSASSPTQIVIPKIVLVYEGT